MPARLVRGMIDAYMIYLTDEPFDELIKVGTFSFEGVSTARDPPPALATPCQLFILSTCPLTPSFKRRLKFVFQWEPSTLARCHVALHAHAETVPSPVRP